MKPPLRPILCLLLLVTGSLVRAFEDPSARNNRLLYDYIDTVAETVDPETFERVPFGVLMSLSRRLGQIERYHLGPEAFFDHARQAVEVRDAFDFKGGLSDMEFETYVLPLRIRYETTAHSEWRSFLRREFSGQVADLDAGTAAGRILDAVSSRVTLDGEFTYTLAYRGDLDPLTTWRGRRGDEVDVAILGCAALRSIGIPARLVFTPQIRGSHGGKVWLEYMSPEKEWRAWVPTLVGKVGEKEHRKTLEIFLDGRCGVVFANPADPEEITEQYAESRNIMLPPSRSRNGGAAAGGESGVRGGRTATADSRHGAHEHPTHGVGAVHRRRPLLVLPGRERREGSRESPLRSAVSDSPLHPEFPVSSMRARCG